MWKHKENYIVSGSCLVIFNTCKKKHRYEPLFKYFRHIYLYNIKDIEHVLMNMSCIEFKLNNSQTNMPASHLIPCYKIYITAIKQWIDEWVSDCRLTPKWAILQPYHGENMLNFDEMIMMSALHYTNMLSWIFIVLTHWNNSLWIEMSLHSDKLSWFWDKPVFALSPKCFVLSGEATNTN
jgi:hypothetical protein